MTQINQNKITVKQAATVIALTAVWVVVITDASKFFVGLGIMPVGTLARLLGGMLVPCGVGFLIGWVVSKLSSVSLFSAWLGCTIALLVLTTIGFARGG